MHLVPVLLIVFKCKRGITECPELSLGRISHECGLYLLAAVKFVYAFFPKEQYSREYTGVHKVLEQNPAAQRKLETLYRLCMKDLLSTERIYQLSPGLKVSARTH